MADLETPSFAESQCLHEQWQTMFDLLNDWHASVKSFMFPLSVVKDEESPFPTIWFARSVSGTYLSILELPLCFLDWPN